MRWLRQQPSREDGIALIMAIGILLVLTVCGTTVFVMVTSNARSSQGSKANGVSYSLAEAGLAEALSKISAADDPTDSTILPPTTITLGAGTATYSGTLSGQVWTLTSTGKVVNPTAAAPSEVQRTLTRTVTIADTSTGTFSQPHWARMHHDSIFSCFDIPVAIPVDVTSNIGLCVQPGGSITGASTKVSAGLYVTQDGYALSSGPRAASTATNSGTGTAWTNPSNVTGNDTSRATVSPPTSGGLSQNLDITGFGFGIPAGSSIDGITVSVDKFASGSSVTDYDVYLIKGGVSGAGDDKSSGSSWGTTESTSTYGSSADLWNLTWTSADINASNFGVRIKVRNGSSSARTASIDYVTVKVDYHGPPGGIGTSGTPVTSFNAPTCRTNGGSWNSPCTSADFVWANTITDNLAIAFKPRINWSFWYTNAGLGPKKGCTETSGIPPAFDSNGSYDGSNAVKELTPETGDYMCRRRDAAGNVVGELSWNRTTRVLTILGPIFFDGGVDFQGSTSPVHYQGRGTIWSSEQIRINEAICAGGSGATNCRSAITTWDSNTNDLLLVGGGQMSYWTDSIIVNTDTAAFQGMLYGRYDCEFTNNVQISAPVLCHRLNINTGATNPVFNQFTMPTTVATGQAYVGGTTSDTQLLVGNQSG
jgi:Tfp pilus assembly protein PilX